MKAVKFLQRTLTAQFRLYKYLTERYLSDVQPSTAHFCRKDIGIYPKRACLETPLLNLTVACMSSESPVVPPPVVTKAHGSPLCEQGPPVIKEYDLEPHATPASRNVSMLLRQSTVLIGCTFTKFFRKHHAARIIIDSDGNRPISVRWVRLPTKLSEMVLLNNDLAVVLAGGTLSVIDFSLQTVSCVVESVLDVSRVVRLDDSSFAAFSAGFAYVIRMSDGCSYDVRRIDEPVSHYVTCCFDDRFVTLHAGRGVVRNKHSMDGASFVCHSQMKVENVILSEKWLVVHYFEGYLSRFHVYNAQTLVLSHSVSSKSYALHSKLELVGDLLFWNRNDGNYFKFCSPYDNSLNLSWMMCMDVCSGHLLWKAVYSSFAGVPGGVYPFKVLKDATVLIQSSNHMFDRLSLPQQIARPLRASLEAASM